MSVPSQSTYDFLSLSARSFLNKGFGYSFCIFSFSNGRKDLKIPYFIHVNAYFLRLLGRTRFLKLFLHWFHANYAAKT